MSNELAGYAAVIAVEGPDHGGGITGRGSSVSKYCVSVRTVGVSKDAERRAGRRESTAKHPGAEAGRSRRTEYAVRIPGRPVGESTQADPAIGSIIAAEHAVAVWADTLSGHTVGKAGRSVRKSGDAGSTGARAVTPYPEGGAARSGCGLATDPNPLHTRSKDASAVSAGA